MPKGKRGRGRRITTVPNVSQRAGGSTTASRRTTPLPSQYNFTPAAQVPPTQSPQSQVPDVSSTPHIRNYPPPQQLFQNSLPQHREDGASPSSQEVQNNPFSPLQDPPASPLQNSQAQSHPSSQGNNFNDDFVPILPDLHEDVLQALNNLLQVPDRENFTTVLSPSPRPNTTWFTRDKGSKLVRKITKIFTNKFDGPYYTWTCVPRKRQERYFLEFAKTHTWDPLITGTVQHNFEKICQRRMKDMVSTVRGGERPKWIDETIWKTMTEYWETEEAQHKSDTYSKVRLSPRGGLGAHVHLSGPTSYQQLQQDLEEKLGRPVSLGEVFIAAHTKPDGSYVDRKAEIIVQTYQKNVEEKLAELAAEASIVSDGASRPRELTADEYTTIFLQSTEKNSQGTPYGVGSLKDTLVNGKRKQHGDSSSFVALEEQMKKYQRQIEEQAAYNEQRDAVVAARDAAVAAREAEHARAVAEQKNKIENLSLVEKYLRQTDPQFLTFLASHSTSATTTEPLGTTPTPT